MASNGVIGRDNTLPWHLPEDLRHFKAVTLGKPVLMGRRTFESIGKPLPGRTNLVLTHNRAWHAEGAVTLHSMEEALSRAEGEPDLAGIGGAEIFRLLLPRATRIYLTRVHAEIPGDTVFPSLDPTQWAESDLRTQAADARNAYRMTFVTLDRITPTG
jgi:dihydrofolate reductase